MRKRFLERRDMTEKTATARRTYERYEKARVKEGLSDYDVAKTSGVSPSTIGDWKAGRSTPKAEKLIAITKLLGVTVEWLYEKA